jgi:hypothetical protein
MDLSFTLCIVVCGKSKETRLFPIQLSLPPLALWSRTQGKKKNRNKNTNAEAEPRKLIYLESKQGKLVPQT